MTRAGVSASDLVASYGDDVLDDVSTYLRSLPVEERMKAMGMVAIEVVADDGETADVWIERGNDA